MAILCLLFLTFTTLIAQTFSYSGTETDSSIQDIKYIDEVGSKLTTTYYLPLESRKNKKIEKSQKNTLLNQQDYKTKYGYNFKTRDDNINIDPKSIQRKESIGTQNNIMQSKYHPSTYLTIVETSFFSPDKNMYTNFLTPVTSAENKTKTKHFANNKYDRNYKIIIEKSETDIKIFERKQKKSTQITGQQSDYLTIFITTVTSPETSSLNKTTKKAKALRNRQRHNLKSKVGSKTHNTVEESDDSDTVKSLEVGNYTSMFKIARRLSNPFPDFNDPNFQNILNEYRSKVQRTLNINRDPRQFDEQNIINKMQEYQKMAKLNGGNRPRQYSYNNPVRNIPNQNYQSFKHPRNIYSPMTGPPPTLKYRGYRYPGQMAWQSRNGWGWQPGFVGGNQYGRPGRQGHNFGPDRPQSFVQEPARGDIWQAYKMPKITEPTPPMYEQDRRPGETIDFFGTPPHADETQPGLPEAAMNITASTTRLTVVMTRFTTVKTTTTRRLRTTPPRPDFDEDCDYTAYYCLKAYDTGQLCARTLYNQYATFKNYCMVDFVNCMERYETWVIIHMGECFEIKLVSQYVHYPYMDDYFLDQYYLNENM